MYRKTSPIKVFLFFCLLPAMTIALLTSPLLAREPNRTVRRYSITVLNVAGARASKAPMIYQAVMDLLDAAFILIPQGAISE